MATGESPIPIYQEDLSYECIKKIKRKAVIQFYLRPIAIFRYIINQEKSIAQTCTFIKQAMHIIWNNIICNIK